MVQTKLLIRLQGMAEQETLSLSAVPAPLLLRQATAHFRAFLQHQATPQATPQDRRAHQWQPNTPR